MYLVIGETIKLLLPLRLFLLTYIISLHSSVAFLDPKLASMRANQDHKSNYPNPFTNNNSRNPIGTAFTARSKNFDDFVHDEMHRSKNSEWKPVVKTTKNRSQYGNSNINHESNVRKNNVWTPPFVKPIAKPEGYKQNSPKMLILVGIPGSGKSTFACSLEKAMPWRYRRINQDTLKTRRKCEVLCRKVLAEGYVAVIDRCNFDETQRSHFLNIASEMNVSVECILFDYSVEECISRCDRRKNHETIKPGEAAPIVRRMKSSLKVPNINATLGTVENFQSIIVIDDLNKANDTIRKYLKIL